jgi:hypothetical protein
MLALDDANEQFPGETMGMLIGSNQDGGVEDDLHW